MTTKEKDKAVDEFMNNPKVTVFICNLVAASVGLTLTSSNIIIFNSYSFSATDNEQMEYRIYRLNQTKDVTCVYQLFTDSISKDMFERFWLYLNFTSRLMESCQKKCIANYKSNSLEIGEQVCVERCTKKWIEVYNYIVALQEPKAAK